MEEAILPLLAVAICALCALVCKVSWELDRGWRQLIRKFPSGRLWPNTCLWFHSARVNGSLYGSQLAIAVDRDGLYLSLWHGRALGRPAFIPWTRVTLWTVRKKFMLFWERDYTIFRFGIYPDIPLQLDAQSARTLLNDPAVPDSVRDATCLQA